MWQKLTERARKGLFYAQEEACRLGENYVSTEHLLLGLVRDNDNVVSRILDQQGMSPGRIRSEIEKQITRGDGRLGQDMRLTPRAMRVMDLAYIEARQLSNKYIGTEHILLGLIREGDGLAGRVLAKLGIDLERTREDIRVFQTRDEYLHRNASAGQPVYELPPRYRAKPPDAFAAKSVTKLLMELLAGQKRLEGKVATLLEKLDHPGDEDPGRGPTEEG